MAKRQLVETVFNRGLNALSPRALLKRGQSIVLTNFELLESCIRRRRGKKGAYEPPVVAATGPVTALQRFYHLSSAGVLKTMFRAYGQLMYRTDSDWADGTATLIDDANNTAIAFPTGSDSLTPPTLPEAHAADTVSVTSGYINSAIQSRQWLYVQTDYASGDNTDDVTNIPMRTACGVSPSVGNDYGAHSFAHGLYPTQSLSVEDTEDSPIPPSGDWARSVDPITATFDKDSGTRWMALDSSTGILHVVFHQSGDPYYAYRSAAGVWASAEQIVAATVNSVDRGSTSMVLDDDGFVHVAFQEAGGSDDLWYATNKSGSWVAEAVVTSGDVGDYTSIILTSKSRPGILYYKADATVGLYYIEQNDDGTWSGPASAIDATSANIGSYVSAKADSTGKIHAAYEDTTNGNLRYITRDAGSLATDAWNTGADINSSGTWGGDLCLDIDSDDNPGVVANEDVASTFTPALWKLDGTWSEIGSVSQSNSSSLACIVTFDPEDTNNIAHIAYNDSSGTNGNYYANDSNGTVSDGVYYGISLASFEPSGIVVSGNKITIYTIWVGGGSDVHLIHEVDRSTYFYKLTAEYDDGKLGESGPSTHTLISYDGDVRSSNPKVLTLNPTDDRYDMAKDATKIHIYRTVKGGSSDSLYYRAGSIDLTNGAPPAGSTGTFTDNVPDATLVTKVILDEDVFMPPKYKTSTFWKDRIVIGHLKARDTSATEGTELDLENDGYHPNRIRFSRGFKPDVFPANYFIDVDIGGESATVRRLIVNKRLDALMCFLEDDTVIVTGDTPLGERGSPFRPTNIPNADGTPAKNSVVSDGEGNIFAWTKTGIQVFEGAGCRYITENTIKPLWNALDTGNPLYNRRINMDQIGLTAGVYVPGEEKILWSYPSVANVYNTAVLCLDLRRWRERGRREDGFSIFTGWAVSKWCVWRGEGDRNELFGGEAQSAVGPWVYRCLFGNDDETGTTTDNTVSTSQITGVIKTGAFDFGHSDRIRKFRNIVINAKADAGDVSDDTSLAVVLDINDGALSKSLGTWDPTGGTIKHLTSGIPRDCIGTYGSLQITSTDTDSPDPWELYSVGLEVEELPSRTAVG